MPTSQQLRSGTGALALLAERDLAALWRTVTTAEQAQRLLEEALPGIVERYGSAAAALAADWYDDLRDELGVRGRFSAFPAEVGDRGTDALAGWGVGPLYAADPDWNAARTLVAGGLQRRIADVARETITGSSIEDPAADGWQRVGQGTSCTFCRMLIGRGSVYTEAGVEFGAHDHCNCGAAPAFGGHPRPVKPYEVSERRKRDENGDLIPSRDAARAREWIKDNR